MTNAQPLLACTAALKDMGQLAIVFVAAWHNRVICVEACIYWDL